MVEILPLLVAPVARKVAREERERESPRDCLVSFTRDRVSTFPPPLPLPSHHIRRPSNNRQRRSGKKKLVDDDRRWITFASFSPRFRNTEKANELEGSKFHTRTGDSLVFLLISGAREKRRGSIFFFFLQDPIPFVMEISG